MAFSTPSLSVVMPALNEEANIMRAVKNTLEAFDDYEVDGEIIVINDGSTDRTKEIVESLIIDNTDRVRLISHDSPQGIGASFWDGVDHAQKEIVTMFPGDNENDPWEILRYLKLLEHVDIVIPFVFNKQVRSLARNALSLIYRFIINTTFMVYFNYTNGTVLYRKSILVDLDYRSSSFFFQTDILIRTVKQGILFAEVPYRLGLRKTGVSKAVTFPSFMHVAKGYLRLVKDLYTSSDRDLSTHPYPESSSTAKRHDQQSKFR
ncbi:MAG: glycosyltransferase family 2 protein [Candidatus Nitrohelix vancouverensis]|uniref:Glycosyltransferase family 2 protein n=1 Tax=Candidatus Nitrohelix vancouverensis TaxID=2705534 RepID=A0A7T0C2F6_9BACT|nr:MAG: glycosyltransferase family 2 protein [Candidatus Nitrohelix vancouverensis]